MGISGKLAEERRGRLAAERLLELKQEELFAANRKLGRHTAHKAQRKGNITVSIDHAFIGFFQASHHLNQCGLACPIGGQNTQGRAQLNPERDAVKNNLSLGACPKGLTDVIEF
jgi:hypothetical protein